MSWNKLRHLAIGAVIALVLIVPLGVYAFVESGAYDVAASRPHTRFTEWITHETMIHSVKRRAASIAAPAGFTRLQVLAGFCTYETHCVACHGASGVAREPWVAGMEPQPPYLVDATSKWTPSQLFWIARNGIKMTGMPSWRDSMSDDQIWDVVGFLEATRQLPPQTYLELRSRNMCGGFGGPWPASEPPRQKALSGRSSNRRLP